MTEHPTETDAVRADAEARFGEPVAVRKALLPDADDPLVLSELTTIESQIRSAEQVLSQ
jgi:hypothetical protein